MGGGVDVGYGGCGEIREDLSGMKKWGGGIGECMG